MMPLLLWTPAWSSFAVRGDLFFTQEQRGDVEVVVDRDQPILIAPPRARTVRASAPEAIRLNDSHLEKWRSAPC